MAGKQKVLGIKISRKEKSKCLKEKKILELYRHHTLPS